MKKILYLIGLFFILSISTIICAEKIAVINITEVFKNISIIKEISIKLKKEFKDRVNELQNMEKDLQIMIKNFKKKTINNSNKKDIKIFQVKSKNFIKKLNEFKQDNKRRQEEERYKVFKIIQKVTKLIAEKEHYDIIIDINTVLYPENISKLKDITNLVIKKIN